MSTRAHQLVLMSGKPIGRLSVATRADEFDASIWRYLPTIEIRAWERFSFSNSGASATG